MGFLLGALILWLFLSLTLGLPSPIPLVVRLIRTLWKTLYTTTATRKGHPYAIGRLLLIIAGFALLTAIAGNNYGWREAAPFILIAITYNLIYRLIRKSTRIWRYRLPTRHWQ
jgi:hypothetical protein